MVGGDTNRNSFAFSHSRLHRIARRLTTSKLSAKLIHSPTSLCLMTCMRVWIHLVENSTTFCSPSKPVIARRSETSNIQHPTSNIQHPTVRILFIGDIVGKPGRDIVGRGVAALIAERQLDLVVANAENAAGGSGLTPAIY